MADSEDGLSFVATYLLLRKHITQIGLSALLGAVIGVTISLIQTPVYRSKVVFATVSKPFSERAGVGGASSLASLGKLAGLDLSSSDTELSMNLEVLKSREMVRQFIAQEGIGGEVGEARGVRPNQVEKQGGLKFAEDNIDYFREYVRYVSPASTPGIYSLEIEWGDPVEASEWAAKFIEGADSALRLKAIARSDANMNFLRERLQKETSVEIQSIINELIGQEMKSRALAADTGEYAFRIIDPASVPVRKAKPQSVVIVLLAVISSLLLSSLYVLARDSIRKASLNA